VRPVLDVVRVDEAMARAAGELAAPVASPQRAAERGVDRPVPAPHVEHLAVAVRRHDDPGVTAEPARGFGPQRGAAVQLAATACLALGREGVDIDENRHLRAAR
jgi:hypothetical protein